MSFANPTPLRLGATGTLHGWRVRVVGRVVMGMDDGGAVYYWNEYNLVDETGSNGTLVYEETEEGPEWKLFTWLEPAHSMTVAEAQTKRVGQTVNLDGKPTSITLVDQSRVYHIEGTAPDGVQVGDVANYFNADAGDRMLVASWTGDEIEFYEGRDLRADEVAAAFGFTVPRESISSFTVPQFSGGGGSGRPAASMAMKIVALALVAFAIFAAYSCFRSQSRSTSASPAKRAAPTLQLATGAQGTLDGRNVVVAGQALVEIGRVGARHDAREYQLLTDARETALLVQSLEGGAKEWHLLWPTEVPASLTMIPPYEAGALRRGTRIAVGPGSFPVSELRLTKALTTSGPDAAAQWPAVQYGFIGREANEWLVGRWTEQAIHFYRGKVVPESDVVAALGQKSVVK